MIIFNNFKLFHNNQSESSIMLLLIWFILYSTARMINNKSLDYLLDQLINNFY